MQGVRKRHAPLRIRNAKTKLSAYLVWPSRSSSSVLLLGLPVIVIVLVIVIEIKFEAPAASAEILSINVVPF